MITLLHLDSSTSFSGILIDLIIAHSPLQNLIDNKQQEKQNKASGNCQQINYTVRDQSHIGNVSEFSWARCVELFDF